MSFRPNCPTARPRQPTRQLFKPSWSFNQLGLTIGQVNCSTSRFCPSQLLNQFCPFWKPNNLLLGPFYPSTWRLNAYVEVLAQKEFLACQNLNYDRACRTLLPPCPLPPDVSVFQWSAILASSHLWLLPKDTGGTRHLALDVISFIKSFPFGKAAWLCYLAMT